MRLVSAEQIADAIIRIYEDDNYAYKLSEKGLAWYGKQTWEKATGKIITAAEAMTS
jgi:hypothetical protein